MKKVLIAIFVTLLFCSTIFAQVSHKTRDADAFARVDVIPMDKERVLQNQTVIIRNGRISQIGDAKRIKIPKDALRIDGKEKYKTGVQEFMGY